MTGFDNHETRALSTCELSKILGAAIHAGGDELTFGWEYAPAQALACVEFSLRGLDSALHAVEAAGGSVGCVRTRASGCSWARLTRGAQGREFFCRQLRYS